MKRLSNYIFEALSGAYNKPADDWKTLAKNVKFSKSRFVDEIKQLLIQLSGGQTEDDINMHFLYSEKGIDVKISNAFKPDLALIFNQKIDKGFISTNSNYQHLKMIINSNDKYIISVQDDNKPNKYNTIILTGKGSEGRTETIDQENATCIVYNKVQDLNITPAEAIKQVCSELNLSKGWDKSLQLQMDYLYQYISKEIKDDPKNYRIERFGEGVVGAIYKKFIEKYIKILKPELNLSKINIDTIDPSDVVMYKQDIDAASILNGYISSLNKDNYMEIKKDYLETQFLKHNIIGVSLKKLSGGTSAEIVEFNTGKNNIGNVIDYTVMNRTKQGVSVECRANMDLFNVSTPDETGEVGRVKDIEITMRTFGNNNLAIDSKIKRGVALGKCSVNIWRRLLNVDKKDDYNKVIDEFQQKLNDNKNKKEALNILTQILKGTVKEGLYCFPYILIH